MFASEICQFYIVCVAEVGLLRSESEAGRRPELNIFSHISVLHKRRCSEFIAQDSRSLLTLTMVSQ